MDIFDSYTYARTLRFFEAYYPYDNEDVHYADIMLSMNQLNTIDELIAVRELLKAKISQMGSVVILDKLPQRLIEGLSKNTVDLTSNNTVLYNHRSTNIKDNLRYDVDSCYDENVFRLFWGSDTITAEICGEFFINLSRCENKTKYKVPIINVAKERSNIDVSELLTQIAQRYDNFGKHWKIFKEFDKGMNGYNSAKKVVEDDFAYLKKFNWRLLPGQKSLYEEIDTEEQKKEEERGKKTEDEKKRKKAKLHSNMELIFKVVIGIIFIGIFAVCLYYAEAYVLTILVLLALIKTGVK